MNKTKPILLFLLIVSLLVSFTACSAYQENTFFSKELLSEAGLDGLPKPSSDKENVLGYNTLYLLLDESEYADYVSALYNHLISRNFTHFGTRGDQLDTLAGMFTNYAFFPCTALEDCKGTSSDTAEYRFVFSNENEDEDLLLNAYVLAIYRDERSLLDYESGSFIYNTRIKLYAAANESYNTKNHQRTHSIRYATTDYLTPTCGVFFEAAVGSEVKICTHVLLDIDLEVYVNGQKIEKTHSDSDYWEYTFIMPNREVTVTFQTVGGQ